MVLAQVHRKCVRFSKKILKIMALFGYMWCLTTTRTPSYHEITIHGINMAEEVGVLRS